MRKIHKFLNQTPQTRQALYIIRLFSKMKFKRQPTPSLSYWFLSLDPPMELNSIVKLIFFFILLSSFTFLSRAKLNLDRSDYNAFKIIQRDLGIDLQHPSFIRNPCNSPSVSCELHNLTSSLRITRISYDSENLPGFVSPLVGQLSELRELTLSNNKLVDQLPLEIVQCKKLEILNLKNNRFSGEISSELSKLSQLRELDLSSNRFNGELSFLTYFPNLEILSLSDNLFIGKIPASLRSFRNLRLFDISGNEYIDQGSEVSRRSLVPKRYRLAENSNSTVRSRGRKSSLAPAQAPSPSHSVAKHEKPKKKKKWGAWVLAFLGGGILGGISGAIFAMFVKVGLILIQGRAKAYAPVIFSPLIKKAEDLAFLEKEDGLVSLQMIGKGGCGEVYKAELPGSGGKIIAIKKIYEPQTNAADLNEEDSKMLNKKMRQIRSEIQTVGKIRHRNLLSLLAHVPRPNCHFLIYEYMKNGSLEDIMRAMVLENREFDWSSRYRVTLGVAAGLEHLHMNNNPRIIHRDLKPANILLDDDMEARIADFGLAKEIPLENTHMSTSNVAGTVGYIAPEYYQTFKFTEKCDIYSLGVVLGSLVMGKLPGDNFFQNTEEVSLVKWMRNVLISEEPQRAIDPQLMGNGYEEQMLQVLKIACFCTLDDPKQRPNSKDVRCMLYQVNP